jgi:hypothetical protein
MFSYSQWLDELLKAAGHKYIKRIPYQSGGKMRYRYIYHARQTHQGKHIFDPSHLKEGTKLMWHGDDGAQVHVEIKSFDGEHAVIQYDDGPKKGEFDVLSLADLHDRLDAVSGGGKARLSEARAKEEKKLADMHTRGVSSKQLARQKKRVEALGGVSVASPLGLPTSAPASARHAAKKIEDTLSQLDATRAEQMRPKFEKLAQELVSAMENEKRVRSSSGNALRGTASAINKVEQAQYKINQLWNRALQEAQAPSNERALGGDDRESVPTIDDQQDDPASPPNARDIADYLAEQFDNEDGYSAKVWTLDHRTRVYVRRKLVSGWQDMGYFDIDTRGNVTTNFSRNKAGMRQKAETYLREMLS